MNESLTLLGGGSPVTRGNPGVTALDVDAKWNGHITPMPSWAAPDPTNDIIMHLTKAGIYVITACVITELNMPARDVPRWMKVNTSLHWEQPSGWGGTPG